MDYYQYLRNMLANKMQQKFDPNYMALQAELFKMKNPNGPSDTKGQTLQTMMEESPRFGDFMFMRHRADRLLNEDLNKPMTPNGMQQFLDLLERNRQKSRFENMMMGGGV